MKTVKKIAVSEFKAQCLRLVELVRTTKRPIRITRFGRPVADLVPILSNATADDWLGSMAGKLEITGDVLSPVIEQSDFEALQDRH